MTVAPVRAGETRRFNRFAGATGIGNRDDNVTCRGSRCDHALHQSIIIGGHRDIKPKELVLGIQRNRC